MGILENEGKSRDVQRFKEDKKLKSPGFIVKNWIWSEFFGVGIRLTITYTIIVVRSAKISTGQRANG